jgi:tetratricopeptide (TPR) repeat protein
MNRLPVVILFCLLIVGVMLFAEAGNTDDADNQSSRSKLLETRKLLRTASGSMDEGDFKGALTLLDSILTINPSNPDAFFLKGNILLIEGDSATAVEVLNEAIQLAPRSTRIKLLLARIYLNQGTWEKPLELTGEVLMIKPSDREATYLNGWGLLLRGDTTEAVSKFETVLKSELEGKGR